MKSDKTLTEEELMTFAHAWENDQVVPLQPLVEKYGWDGLMTRLKNSTTKDVTIEL